jgi:hypothetical protein
MGATLNAFGIDQIDKARYGLQSQIYTFGPVTLPAGQTTVFQVQNWNTRDSSSANIAKVCILKSIAATQNAGVQITWAADNQQSDQAQGWTDGYPAGLRAYPTFAVAGSNLKLVVNNTTGAPIAVFQLNYGVTVMSLNLFQRLLYGFTANDADSAALQALQSQASQNQDINSEVTRLLQGGNRPFALDSVLMNLFENRRISNPPAVVPFHMAVPANSTASVTKTISVGGNLVYVLRGISLEGAAAGMNIVIDRDSDAALVNQLNAAAFAQADDLPWPFFIPFNNHIGITCNGSSGATYPVRLDIEAYQSSDLMLAHLTAVGQTGMGTITPKVQIGLQ